jgi:hypothetical protein
MALARAIRVVVGIVVTIILLAVVLRLVDANPGNAIVGDVHDAGAWLVGPFADVFSIQGPKLHMAVNWGLAALVYAIVGGLLASFVARGTAAGFRQRGFGRTRPVARRRGFSPRAPAGD